MDSLQQLTVACLFAAAAIAATGPAVADNQPAAVPPLEVRVMTFNIKQQNPANRQLDDSPNHWKLRRDLVLGIIRDYSPDVVGLQEAYLSQLDDLTTANPELRAVGEGRDGGTRGEHCSILYRSDRFRVAESGTFWLSETPGKVSKTWGHFYHRICTWARLVEKNTERSFCVFNTHLDHKSQNAREKSVRLIARRIHDRRHEDPFILTGDFNAGEDDPVIAYLTGGHPELSPAPVVDSFRLIHPDEKSVGTGNRFSGHIDGRKSDYVFVMPGTGVLEASIIRTHREGRYPSDHFPVTARIRFPAAATPTLPKSTINRTAR